jgi:hypothetical protein
MITNDRRFKLELVMCAALLRGNDVQVQLKRGGGKRSRVI